ncbi:MAG: TlpA disulfide reductase family protein [Halothiobacillaceae bacterium]|nr:TlpA disulfide reductase family protein [Halothiobacillaceae bacterium]
MRAKNSLMAKTSMFLALLLASVLASASAWAVDFSLKDLQGKSHSLSDYQGKFVVVNFWATWCPPCREEIPELIRFHDTHQAKDAVVWGVSYEKIDSTRLAKFVDEQMISYPVLPMNPGQPSPFGAIRGLPTTVLVAPDGSVARTHLGGITHEMIERYMREWCKTPAGKEIKVCR